MSMFARTRADADMTRHPSAAETAVTRHRAADLHIPALEGY